MSDCSLMREQPRPVDGDRYICEEGAGANFPRTKGTKTVSHGFVMSTKPSTQASDRTLQCEIAVQRE
jgi:hypothetical protein